MDMSGSAAPNLDGKVQLAHLQRFLTLPRETIPRLTAQEAGRYLRGAAERLGLEYIEIAEVVPTFLLLPPSAAPSVLLFQTWHAEAAPVEPAAVEGAERLALGVAVAGMGAAREGLGTGVACGLVVAPSATAGSRGLDRVLREHRVRLAAPAALWLRIAPTPAPETRRRRVFLGARGRVVIALRGGDANPYRLRDAVVGELRELAYGPRPLDFELIRKLAQRPEALELLGPDPIGAAEAEARVRSALFDPLGAVLAPPVAHPDRPRAWLTFEIAEGMEPDAVAARVRDLAGAGGADPVELLPWDRANIHHPAIHALIEESKARSEGAEIWPSSPWPTPSGVFSRALGVGLSEWGIPLPAGAAIRFPKTPEFEGMAREAAAVILRSSQPT